MTILQPIFEHDPKRPAAMAGTATIAYGRLCADIDAMAHWLFTQGLKPGDRVTLHVREIGNPDYWDWIMHLGVIRAGLVHSTGPMPPAIAGAGLIGPYRAAIGVIEGLAKQANPQLRLPFAPRQSVPLSDQLEIADRRDLSGLEDKAVRLLSTSGTTGKPKLLAWDARMIDARLKQVREIGCLNADTRLLTLLGLITTTGFRYPIAGWQRGALVLLAGIGDERTDMAAAAALSTFLAASPFRMQAFLPQAPGQWKAKSKRIIELFGGRVPPGLRDEVLGRCCSALLMSYGATEVGRVACGATSLVDRHPGAVGMIEPGITVEILDRHGKPCPPGETGIVRMKSDFMCKSYIGRAAGPASSLRGGWFYPGDFGILFEDGLFAIAGRSSQTINVAGAKLDPVALEEKIVRLPEVDDVAVLSLPLDARDVLTIAVACGDGVDIPALRQKIAPLLPRHFPFVLVRLKEIPRNAMGRIPRQALTKAVTDKANQAMALQRKQAPKTGA